MHLLTKTVLVVVGVLHLLPLSGVLGAAHLERLYGLALTEPDLVILMRHRSVLFGLLGVFLIYAAFRPDLRWPALLAGLVSTASFLGLAWSVGGYSAPISRVVVADVAAVSGLILAGVTELVRSAAQS